RRRLARLGLRALSRRRAALVGLGARLRGGLFGRLLRRLFLRRLLLRSGALALGRGLPRGPLRRPLRGLLGGLLRRLFRRLLLLHRRALAAELQELRGALRRDLLDGVALAEGRVRLAVGDVRAEAALAHDDGLLAERVLAE